MSWELFFGGRRDLLLSIKLSHVSPPAHDEKRSKTRWRKKGNNGRVFVFGGGRTILPPFNSVTSLCLPHLNHVHFPIPFINPQKHLILPTNPLIPTALRQFFQLHELPFEVLRFVGITCGQGSQMQLFEASFFVD